VTSLKAAIIGLGNIAPMHINSLDYLGIPITAKCDIRPTEGAFTSYEEMLAAGGFDVLHICLPHHLHAQVAIAALQKGYHVLTEKPMATTVADAEKMLGAAQASHRQLGVIFQNRYSPGAQLIKESLPALGAVQGGWLQVTWHRPEEYYKNSQWHGRWATEGGGAVITQSIHTFDMMNYFLGEPTNISAAIANRAHPSIEVEDVAEGVITYGGAKISFYVNTFHPHNAPASLELVCQNGRATLIGEDAEITFTNGRKLTASADTSAQQRFGMKSYWGVSHVKQIQDFYNSLATGQPVKIDGYEGLRTQRLVDGIYGSAKGSVNGNSSNENV